ncbi:MAG: GmrSD restriction endonuclease domain-containing protein [Anaerolineae bacterium]
MAIEQLKVREIVRQAFSKNVDIPEFQREFVWDAEQVKLFAESLYRDYPVGVFLFWDSSQYQEAKTAQGTQASLWIVDGQQRTTALCLLLGMKPYWWPDAQDWNEALKRYDVMVNLLPGQDDDRLEFALPNPIRRREPHWVGVRRVLGIDKVEELTSLAQSVAERVAPSEGDKMTTFTRIHGRLQRLWQVRERDIPVIKIDHEVEDVAEIFSRLNQAGTRVKEADVVLALAAVRNPGWVREEYLPFRAGLEERGWDLDAGVFIRTVTGIGRGRARLIEVPREFWNPEHLREAWKKTRKAISETVKRLAEFGILSVDLLPSANSLIPLFALQHRWGDSPSFDFRKALLWFLLANRDGRYSGSAITSLNEDVRAIVDAKSFREALAKLRERLQASPKLEEDEFLNRYDRAGSRFLRLMLYLVLFGNNACDWIDRTRLGYDKTGSPITTGFQPQWHHIYPRRVLREAEQEDEAVHALANLTVLNERTNVNKLSGKEPWCYLRQFGIGRDVLQPHLVPDAFIPVDLDDGPRLREQWYVARYPDFVIERAQLLARAANDLLLGLEGP